MGSLSLPQGIFSVKGSNPNSKADAQMKCFVEEDEAVFLKGLRDGERGKAAKSEDLGQNWM